MVSRLAIIPIVTAEGVVTSIRLERVCWVCDGKREYGPECDMCHGLGVIPTDEGDAVLAFLSRHQRIDISVGANVR
jgi:DnaJ-class molecular chaperone